MKYFGRFTGKRVRLLAAAALLLLAAGVYVGPQIAAAIETGGKRPGEKVSYYNGEYNKLCLDGGLDDANGFYSTYGTLRLRGDETSYMLQAGPRRRQYPPFRLQGGQARCERHEHGGQ